MPDEEGRAHPTIGGLRIGKQLPERKPNEFQDEMLEWERDAQYFHYLTRWCQALLNTFQDTNDRKYGIWAAELLKAGEKFIAKTNGARMYWKMNIDLSAPAVPSRALMIRWKELLAQLVSVRPFLKKQTLS